MENKFEIVFLIKGQYGLRNLKEYSWSKENNFEGVLLIILGYDAMKIN